MNLSGCGDKVVAQAAEALLKEQGLPRPVDHFRLGARAPLLVDDDGFRRQTVRMKVAGKTLRKRAPSAPSRATLTLNAETYAKIDKLRGGNSRSAWVQELIDKEEERREREQFIALVHEQYTPAVCRQTLALNDEYPVHEA